MVESIPDLTPMLKPTTVGDFARYFFASAGGLFLGGELGRDFPFYWNMSLDGIVLIDVFFVIGFLAGTASANRSIAAEPESRKRIETAFKRFRADVLRKEADELDKGASVWDKMFH